ncbi:MAG TPA: pitrilysin family protein [Bryobacteraceae bacterium]|nr:pitrilysin family protein [Bryobacteraceae bacterium]
MKYTILIAALSACAAWGQSDAAAFPRLESLKFPELRQVRLPEVATFTLPNGMRVYMLENHELPVVSGSATVRTGNLFEPANKVGLAGITGSVLRTGGTKQRTGEQIDESLENMAASVESGIGETSGSVSFNALRENTDEVLEIFKDVLTNPEFRQDKINLIKTQTKSALARRNDDPGSIAGREFASVVYGRNNAYGWDQTYEHVDNITREDLLAFYSRYFFPSNIMLSVYGDFKPAEMRAKLEKLFADWTVKQEAVPPFPKVTAPKDSPGVYLATKTDVTQTFFELGHLGGVLRDKDYPALSIMSDILGGGFASRLFLKVRTEQGLAYSVGGGWGANYGHEGLFRIAGSTKSASTVDALQSIRKEIDRLRTEEVTKQELETARQSVLNSFVFAFDHPRKILGRYVVYEYWGYPRDFIYQYQKAVQAVTAADVLRVAKAHLSPERIATVAVGNPKEFGKPLTAIGAVKELKIDLPQPGAKPVSKANPASVAKGAELLERARKALGGSEKLEGIRDFHAVTDITIAAGQAQGMKVKSTVQWIAPDVLRSEQELPFGKLVAVWNGKEGWMSTPQGTMAMPPPVQQQIIGELFRLPMRLYLSDKDANRQVNAIGENTVEITGQNGQAVRIDFDPATGLPARTSYQGLSMQGEPQQTSVVLSDWKELNGMKVPYQTVIEQGGQKFATGVVASVEFNKGLKVEEIGAKP